MQSNDQDEYLRFYHSAQKTDQMRAASLAAAQAAAVN